MDRLQRASPFAGGPGGKASWWVPGQSPAVRRSLTKSAPQGGNPLIRPPRTEPMNYVSATSQGLDPVSRAREVGPLIAEAADQIERDQQIPAPLLAKLIETRLPRMLLPRSAGGDEIEPWIYLRAIEEISRHDA